jgi:hypothetical protein
MKEAAIQQPLLWNNVLYAVFAKMLQAGQQVSESQLS